MTKKRVLIADDQAMVRAGFAMVINTQDDLEVVGEVATGQEAVDVCLGDLNPDVVLMDIRMPVMDGIKATELITASTDVAVLVLTTFDADEYVYEALRAGASGFLLKDAGPAELLAGIRAVLVGDAVVAPSATKRLLSEFLPALTQAKTGDRAQDRLAVLTDREREVLGAVGQGLSNPEIAESLCLAEATVKTHIGRILAKMQLRDRVQMVILAYDAGIVTPK